MNKNSTLGDFGGSWTIRKLDILEKYLDAYTTALKGQTFRLMYIDAFAGSGQINLRSENEDARKLYEGSAARAVKIHDKPFDRLVFVEKDVRRCQELEKLRSDNSARDIQIENTDANTFLDTLQENWKAWRGVLFLDPFATQVNWATIEKVAGFEALDTWILFPTSAITRMLPVEQKPENVSPSLAKNLTRIFGDRSWEKLYSLSPQQSLFGEDQSQRERGVSGIIELYKKRLEGLFGARFMLQSKTFTGPTNAPLFEFIFCAGHPKGASVAQKIALHILNMED